MKQLDLIFEGKGKQIFKTDEEDKIIIHFKDEATAFNGIKRATLLNKGSLNNEISSILFEELNKAGFPTHFIKKLNEKDQLCKRLDIFPIEFVVRNIVAGSMARRLNLKEGLEIENTVYELTLKNSRLGDPLINEDHAVALNLATYEELNKIHTLALSINKFLIEVFKKIDIILVDYKMEFGKDLNGNIILADEITPDSCRFWDKETKTKLDKDRFRRDLGDVIPAYEEILSRLKNRK